jgi:hypothetical protein
MEKPCSYGQISWLKQRFQDKYPLIPQNYYASSKCMTIGPTFPAVAKVGHAHASLGKMKIEDHHQFQVTKPNFTNLCLGFC